MTFTAPFFNNKKYNILTYNNTLIIEILVFFSTDHQTTTTIVCEIRNIRSAGKRRTHTILWKRKLHFKCSCSSKALNLHENLINRELLSETLDFKIREDVVSIIEYEDDLQLFVTSMRVWGKQYGRGKNYGMEIDSE